MVMMDDDMIVGVVMVVVGVVGGVVIVWLSGLDVWVIGGWVF